MEVSAEAALALVGRDEREGLAVVAAASSDDADLPGSLRASIADPLAMGRDLGETEVAGAVAAVLDTGETVVDSAASLGQAAVAEHWKEDPAEGLVEGLVVALVAAVVEVVDVHVGRRGSKAAAASEDFANQPSDCRPSCCQQQVAAARVLAVEHSVSGLPIEDREVRLRARQVGRLAGARPAAVARRLGWANR